MTGDLTFIAKYSRKVQPWSYESINFGLDMPFPITENERDTQQYREKVVEDAFKVVVDLVETEIDRRLQELYARERR